MLLSILILGLKESDSCVQSSLVIPTCLCVVLVHARECDISTCAPLEESSKGAIIDRRMNSAFYFLRQMSGLTLMVHRRDEGMSGKCRL